MTLLPSVGQSTSARTKHLDLHKIQHPPSIFSLNIFKPYIQSTSGISIETLSENIQHLSPYHAANWTKQHQALDTSPEPSTRHHRHRNHALHSHHLHEPQLLLKQALRHRQLRPRVPRIRRE
ncbi:hypothetical protein IMZ48_02595 [Candidatus Bathyarchaeota archaeon]|nr:hypothetical protein [Candidatus Bathyarchaeota archaeon]